MAKAAKETGGELAVQETANQLPEGLGGFLQEHLGEGISTAAEDKLIPLIYVLQQNSPQVNSRDPNYVPGAKAGDFWLRGTNKFWDGSRGLPFQSCHWMKNFVEWIPRDAGGGIVAQHDAMPADAREVPSPKNPDKKVWVNAKGDHEYVETRYHAGYILDNEGALAAVIPLSSTGNTVSRNWMNQMNSFKMGGQVLPSYSRGYLLTTVQKTNKSGTWFTIKVEDKGWLPLDQVREGQKLYESFERGVTRAQTLDEGAQQGAGEEVI